MPKLFRINDVVKIMSASVESLEVYDGIITTVIKDTEYTPVHCVNVNINHNEEGGLNIPINCLALVSSYKDNDFVKSGLAKLTDQEKDALGLTHF